MQPLQIKAFLPVAVAALLSVASLCQEPERQPWTQTPEGFVIASLGAHYEYKAVSPDGSALGVRFRENTEQGSLSYWTEVFLLEMVEAKNYRLIAKKDVTSADGVPGQALTFEVAQGNVPYHYGLAVFVTEKSIVTLESGTELEALSRYEAAFSSALAALRVKTYE